MHSNEAFRTYTVGTLRDGRVQFREVSNAPSPCPTRDASSAAYLGHGRDGGVCVHSQGDHYPLLVAWVEWPVADETRGNWRIFAPDGRLLWLSESVRNPSVFADTAHARAEELAASYR